MGMGNRWQLNCGGWQLHYGGYTVVSGNMPEDGEWGWTMERMRMMENGEDGEWGWAMERMEYGEDGEGRVWRMARQGDTEWAADEERSKRSKKKAPLHRHL